MLVCKFIRAYLMRFLQNIFAAKAAPEAIETSEVLLSAVPEFEKQQWSALYLTEIELSLADLKALLQDRISFNESEAIFCKEIAPENKISVLNAINPGTFTVENVCGVVILINATSFSEHADTLLKELYGIVTLIVKHYPGVAIGASPKTSFSSEQLEGWLKQQRDRYFFID